MVNAPLPPYLEWPSWNGIVPEAEEMRLVADDVDGCAVGEEVASVIQDRRQRRGGGGGESRVGIEQFRVRQVLARQGEAARAVGGIGEKGGVRVVCPDPLIAGDLVQHVVFVDLAAVTFGDGLDAVLYCFPALLVRAGLRKRKAERYKAGRGSG